ncbi:MAG TPA: sulfotransferase [Chryseolinea sp.]|nr:sulfotransferase [Chryseolinea sp.]
MNTLIKNYVAITIYNVISFFSRVFRKKGNFIFVLGYSRSGTTWLGELLQNIVKKSVLFDEPLQVQNHKRAVEEGLLNHRVIIQDKQHEIELNSYLNDVFNGHAIRPSYAKRTLNNIVKLLSNGTIILKSIRLNIAIDFVQKFYPKNKIICIVRNPFDVVTSQINSSRSWVVKKVPSFYHPVVKSNFDDFPTESLKTPATIQAFNWSLEHYMLKSKLKSNGNLLLLYYSDMLTNRKKNIMAICKFLNVEYNDMYIDLSKTLSKSTAPNSKLNQNEDGFVSSRVELNTKEKEEMEKIFEYFNYPFREVLNY